MARFGAFLDHILFLAHPRTVKRVQGLGFEEKLAAVPDLRVIEPLDYLEFLNLMVNARLMLTNSGGIQEETTILGVPCLTLRENTERPVEWDEPVDALRVCPCKAETVTGLALKERSQLLELMGLRARRG